MASPVVPVLEPVDNNESTGHPKPTEDDHCHYSSKGQPSLRKNMRLVLALPPHH